MSGLSSWKAGSVSRTQGEGRAIAGVTVGPSSVRITNGGTAGMGFCWLGVSIAGVGANWVGDGMWWVAVG